MVVGEVLLRGGEAGSVVPTKVPGNLERRMSEQPVLTCESPAYSYKTGQRHKEAQPPITYMAPWELAAQGKNKIEAEMVPPACPCPPLQHKD